MTITAKIISDSISEHSPRLVTVLCRYPKFIHGELLTHRVFSRNSSSSRAIPIARLIQDVMDDPVIPIHWGKNQRGMQADEECDALVELNPHMYWGKDKYTNKEAWLATRDMAVDTAKNFNEAGYHKQIVNRLIEPWCHINTVITATEWSNFFALRRHPDAQPEMRALADAIFSAMENSKPTYLNPGNWHTPFVRDEEKINKTGYYDWNGAIKLSVARCARTSYMTHEGKEPNVEDDLKLYDRLVGQIPLHASPAEHQATPDHPAVYKGQWYKPHLHGNLCGYIQFRKTLVGENQ